MKETLDKIKWPWLTLASIMIGLATVYLVNFHDHKLSPDPGNWGAVGDYFGGLINPVISAITLFFLIKAYLTQKEELRETKETLNKTEEHGANTARAQAQLVDIQIEQALTSEKLLRVQYLNTKISSLFQIISFYQKEMARCTEARANNRQFVTHEGEELSPGKPQEAHRLQLARSIKAKKTIIEKIEAELESYNPDRPSPIDPSTRPIHYQQN